MHIVYCHTNKTNGKRYIGITPITVKKNVTSEKLLQLRWNSHCYAAKKGSTYVFHKAIRKYGVDTFQHEILEVCDSLKDVLEREIFWIEHYKTMIDYGGYNMTRGGDGVKMSLLIKEKHRLATSIGTKKAFENPTVKLKHKIANINRWKNKKSRDYMSKKQREIRVANPEINKKVSESLLKFWNSDKSQDIRKKRSKQIQQIDIKTDVVLNTFDSVRIAAETLNLNKSAIANCARGLLKQSGGFKWKYVDIDFVVSNQSAII